MRPKALRAKPFTMSLETDSPHNDAPTYYSATATAYEPWRPLKGHHETQVCIIGGGLAGLSIALELAERGVDCALLDAREIAWGASGRNGGFVGSGFSLGGDALVRQLGRQRARALHDLSRRGVELVRERIDHFGLVDARRVDGGLSVWRYDAPDEVRQSVESLAEIFGEDRTVWSRERLREALVTDRYFAALEYRDGFHFHPKNYAIGIAKAAADAGARIFERSPVTAVTLDGATKSVFTSGGEISAETVVFACGGYLGGLEPRLARAILPIATYVITTEAAPERVEAAIRTPFKISDNRLANDYYRVVEGGRILWGGRISARTREPARLGALMHENLLDVYPQLAGLGIDYAWTGLMSYARHKMPQIGQLQPDVWYAMGFGGHGMNTTAMAGELVGTAIAEADDRYRLFAPYGLQWTGGIVGPMAAQTTYWYYQLGNFWRERTKGRRATPQLRREAQA